MSTLAKIIVSTLVSILMMSCTFSGSFGPGIDGNGNVVSIDRNINSTFNQIKVSRGMDVYLNQSSNSSITVEADENLHDIIKTEVEDGILKIYADENIRRSKAQKVYVSFKSIEKIMATSGSDVYAKSEIKEPSLELVTSSGADMEVVVNADRLSCESTSGSDLRVSGTTQNLYASATSGSDIKAGNLKAIDGEVNATSGADITVNTSNSLRAKATSGADVRYYGNPKEVDKSDGVSGSVSKH